MPQGTAVARVESKLKREYPNNAHAVYGVLNKAGLMHGSKVTAKGMRKPRLNRRPAPAPAHTAMRY